jgi:hypothetical protein
MRPHDVSVKDDDKNWCLSDGTDNYLVFALAGGRIDLDLSQAAKAPFDAKWFDPRKGELTRLGGGTIVGGTRISVETPDQQCWVLWLRRSG